MIKKSEAHHFRFFCGCSQFF